MYFHGKSTPLLRRHIVLATDGGVYAHFQETPVTGFLFSPSI
jgi:hypothetical protein